MSSDASIPALLDAAALRALPDPAVSNGCPSCGALACAGWESVPAPLAPPAVERLGTLRPDGDAEPTYQEFHPEGTGYWSPLAPIAPRWFPFNRCEVWRCTHCGRGFLQYTEHGGYYVDHRLRQIDPARVVDA